MSNGAFWSFGDLAEAPRPSLGAFLADLNDAPWTDHALCAQTDPEVWFPTKRMEADAPSEAQYIRAAKAICLACQVRTECLEYALTHGERWGIWGGLTERQRRKLTRRRAES